MKKILTIIILLFLVSCSRNTEVHTDYNGQVIDKFFTVSPIMFSISFELLNGDKVTVLNSDWYKKYDIGDRVKLFFNSDGQLIDVCEYNW